jgi:hypothetical protein
MEGILHDLTTPEWWFTTVIVGILVGITASVTYDMMHRRPHSNTAIATPPILEASVALGLKRPHPLDYVVATHAYLCIVFAVVFWTYQGIQTGNFGFALGDIGFGVLSGALAAFLIKRLAKYSRRAALVTVIATWTAIALLGIGAIGKNATPDEATTLLFMFDIMSAVMTIIVVVGTLLWHLVKPHPTATD